MKWQNNKKTDLRALAMLFTVLLVSIAISNVFANPWNIRHYERDWLKHGYTKFSDFIAKLKAEKRYRYVEDYLELYRFNAYYGEKNMLKNIANLRYALRLKFRSPYQALCKIPNEKYYHKYRLMVFMRIHVMLARNFMRIGAHYDKPKVYFYDIAFARDLQASLKIAALWYKESEKYWQRAQKYAIEASKILYDLDCGYLETQRFDIMTGELDLGRMRKIYLLRLKQKQKKVDQLVQKLDSSKS